MVTWVMDESSLGRMTSDLSRSGLERRGEGRVCLITAYEKRTRGTGNLCESLSLTSCYVRAVSEVRYVSS